jgi:hypothetical protein
MRGLPHTGVPEIVSPLTHALQLSSGEQLY